MDPSNLVAYVIAAITSLAVAYIVGRLRWPRWAYWLFAISCFTGSILTVVLLDSWAPIPPGQTHQNRTRCGCWRDCGIAFNGGPGAHAGLTNRWSGREMNKDQAQTSASAPLAHR